MGDGMNQPPNDRRYFVHKRLIRAAVSLVPGGSTALAVGQALVGRRGVGAERRPAIALAPLRPLGLSEARRAEITRAMREAEARGDTREASAFLRELGAQGPTTMLRSLGLSDPRRREITRAMRAATARGDAAQASAFLRELGAQGPLRPPSIPPVNPVRAAVVQAKPFPNLPFTRPPRARARIPFVQPAGAPAMIQSRARRFAERLVGGPEAPCLPGTIRGPGGLCVDLSAALPGGDPLFQVGVGAVMGRYGPAYQGNSRLVQRTTCLPGDIVGNDGLCYPRKSLTNNERMWPRGRQPLLTGGEMRAISIANRAAGKLERTTKRLQKIGLMKKAAPRRIAPKLPPHQHQISSGG